MLPHENKNNSKIQDSFFSKLIERLRPILNQIAEGIYNFLQKAPENFYILSKYGWYFDIEEAPRKVIELGELLTNGNVEEVDEYLSKHYTNNLKSIEEKLITNYPYRKKIIIEAFKNHNNKLYFSSITMMLTQIDGICYDKTTKLFFKNNPNLRGKNLYRPDVEEELKKQIPEILQVFISSLNRPTAINDNIKNIDKFPIRLNRHEIIHGIDTEFGNELNSLKIISLINYINDLIQNDE